MEKKFINGELLTIEEAYKKHEKLIWNVVHRFKGTAKSSKMSFEDLFMIGCEGFTKAFNRFDYDKFPVRFSTYAVPMIQGEVKRRLRDSNDDIRFSRSVKELAFRILKDELMDQKRDVIAEVYGITIQEVDTALIYLTNRNAQSFETPTNVESDGSETSLGDIVGDKRLFDDTEIHVEEFLNSLDEKNRLIIEMTMKGKVQQEIADTIGISQVQVGRLLKKLKPKVEKFFNYNHASFQKKEEPENMARTAKGNAELAKELLRTTDKSVNEIAKETLCSHSAINYWKRKIRTEEKNDSATVIFTETTKSNETIEIVNAEETNRELIIEESDISFMYSIKNKDLSPSDLHVLFTQIGHAAASSGVKKLDVNLKISVPK